MHQTIFTKLSQAQKPLYLYDDDVDGLCAFLQLYKTFHKKGKGIICKASPSIDESFVHIITKYSPDVVVILDKPLVCDAVLSLPVPIIWIDHHPLQQNAQRDNCLYYNSLALSTPTTSTAGLVYTITQDYPWIALCGMCSDWYIPDWFSEFCTKHEQLYTYKDVEITQILYHSRIGILIDCLGFNLKGQSSHVKKSIQQLSAIESFEEILTQTTTAGEFVWNRYQEYAQEFEQTYATLRTEALENDQLLSVHVYETSTVSITRELSNKLHAEFAQKVILVARLHKGQYKCSIRSFSGLTIPTFLNQIFTQIPGHGGGHENACGACVHQSDWEYFLNEFEAYISRKVYK